MDINIEIELVKKIRKGNKLAFEKVFKFYYARLCDYVEKFTNRKDICEEIVQNVFLKIWEKIPQLKGKDRVRNFRAWLYRISQNLVIDYYRQKDRHANVGLDERQLANQKDLDQEIEVRETHVRLARAIRKLEPIHQEIIAARFINQLSHAETAAIIGKTPGHVLVLQYRALRKLRAILSKEFNG